MFVPLVIGTSDRFMKNNNLSYRVEQLEKSVDKLNNKLERLMFNHIPHLNEEIIGLKTRMNVLSIINVGAIILGAIVARIIP